MIWWSRSLCILHYVCSSLLTMYKSTSYCFLFRHSDLGFSFSRFTVLPWTILCALDEKVIGSDSISDVHIIVKFRGSWGNRCLVFVMNYPFICCLLTIEPCYCVIISTIRGFCIFRWEVFLFLAWKLSLLSNQARWLIVIFSLSVCYTRTVLTQIINSLSSKVSHSTTIRLNLYIKACL